MLSRRIVLFTLPLMLSLAGNAVLADSFTPAQPLAQMGRQYPGKQGRREQLMQQLNLTDTQKQQLASIRQKYDGQIRLLREKMKTTKEDLRQMMTGNDSNSAIRAKHQEIVNLREQLDNLRFESMLELRAILTPQQRTQLAQIMQQRKGAMGSRMHQQNGGNPNPNNPEPDNLSP